MDDVCGWCGFPPRGGDIVTDAGVAYCHGPGIAEPTCWQLASSDGDVVEADFKRDRP